MRCLVLGLGNLLLGDEGVGIHALQALAEGVCPDDVEVLSAGTALLDALPSLEKADHVIIVDAMKADHAPGTIYRVPLEECDFNRPLASLHGLDIARVLSLSGRKTPPEVVVIGVEPAFINWSLELSQPVKEALPDLLAAIRKEMDQTKSLNQDPNVWGGAFP
jgi:hydrogenase maturation protease